MIYTTDISGLLEYCEENRPDQGSEVPWFIPIEVEGGYELPNENLIKKGLRELGIPFKVVQMVEGISVEIDSFDINPNGAYYRRTDQIDENGNYYLEHSPSVVLSDGTFIDWYNKNVYDGAEGWHWYDDGDVIEIASPSTWERIKNWFSS